MAFFRRKADSQYGQSVVEFAFIIPVILFVTLALLDFGRGVHAYIALSSAVREGARFGTTYCGGTCSSSSSCLNSCKTEQTIINRVRQDTGRSFMPPNNVNVTLCQLQAPNLLPNTCSTYRSAEPNRPYAALRVTATFNFNPLLTGMFGGGTFPLTATAQMTFD